jgi:periplasmic protein TonB
LLQLSSFATDLRDQRFRTPFSRRAAGLLAAVVLELLLILLLLSLGRTAMGSRKEQVTEVDLVAQSESEADAPKPEPSPDKPAAAQVAELAPTPTAPESPEPAEAAPTPPPPAAIIPVSPQQMAAADIATIKPRPGPPKAAAGPPMGPPNTGSSGDTPRVGTAPNGEPLFAAAWYREPYDEELRGYLSTASGPGWGLIACRTVPDFRVEDCVELDENPIGSNIGRSVLAAAWQFRVRPPRRGGVLQVGAWVRIRITYDLKTH